MFDEPTGKATGSILIGCVSFSRGRNLYELSNIRRTHCIPNKTSYISEEAIKLVRFVSQKEGRIPLKSSTVLKQLSYNVMIKRFLPIQLFCYETQTVRSNKLTMLEGHSSYHIEIISQFDVLSTHWKRKAKMDFILRS